MTCNLAGEGEENGCHVNVVDGENNLGRSPLIVNVVLLLNNYRLMTSELYIC